MEITHVSDDKTTTQQSLSRYVLCKQIMLHKTIDPDIEEIQGNENIRYDTLISDKCNKYVLLPEDRTEHLKRQRRNFRRDTCYKRLPPAISVANPSYCCNIWH